MRNALLFLVLFIISFSNVKRLGAVELKQELTFINWTDFRSEEDGHDGAISLIVGCYIKKRMSAPINGIDEVDALEKFAYLPPTGVENWKEGRIICSEGGHGFFIQDRWQEPIQVYRRNYRRTKRNRQGYAIIGEDCEKERYWAYLRYLPASHYRLPPHRKHADPLGHYSIYEWCY